MVYGSKQRAQIKVEFEDLYRGWISIHVNMQDGQRMSFYNTQEFNAPSPEEPAFEFLPTKKRRHHTDVLVEAGQPVPMPDNIPREAWSRFYRLMW
eukprot:UN05076